MLVGGTYLGDALVPFCDRILKSKNLRLHQCCFPMPDTLLDIIATMLPLIVWHA